MSKRRATEELYAPESRKRQDASADRAVEFTAHLQALNKQFAQWIQEQAASSSIQLWSAGAKDYVRHADKLLADYSDLFQDGNSRDGPQPAGSLFGSTPAATPAASRRTADLTADATNGPTGGGRRSVSFAPTPNVSQAAETAAATPGTFATINTADAGHTPAPASGLGFSFGATPGASSAAVAAKDFGSPEPIKWGSTPNASDNTLSSTPGTAGFSFGAVTTTSTLAADASASKPAAGDAAADAQPAPKAFSFGVTTSSTPTAAGSSAAAGSSSAAPAVSPVPPSTGGFSFGMTPPPSSSSTPSAAASSSTPASGFTFGALPGSGAAVAAATSSPPLFSFAASGGTSTSVAAAPGMFKFPAPAAPAGDEAAADGDGAEEEAPAKYKPEITVDENTWNIYFNSKARLYVRAAKDGKLEWDPKGVGVLTIRQMKSGGDNSTLITFTNDGGKQLVSSRLQKNTELHIVPEKPNKCRISLTVITYGLPPAGQAEGAAATTAKYSIEVCMISLGSDEKMQELDKVIKEHRPK